MLFSKTRNVKTPTRGTSASAGLDIYVPNDIESFKIIPGEDVAIPTGLHFNIPTGFCLVAFNKSGIATNLKLAVGACVIDEDYQGEIFIHVYNFGMHEITVTPGQKLIQILMLPAYYFELEEVEKEQLFPESSERRDGAFGSTGLY